MIKQEPGKNMKIILGTKKFTVEDDELTVKAAAKLTEGEKLEIKRISDREDTFEIGLYTTSGTLLALMSYADSVGIAPFMDTEEISVRSWVGKSELVKGAKKKEDKVILTAWIEYRYDEQTLEEFSGESFGFIPSDNRLLAAFIAHVLAGAGDIVMAREYLNYFTCDMILQGGTKELFDGRVRLSCSVLTDEKFTKCKINTKIYDKDNNETSFRLTDEEKQTALVFVNHALIFAGEEGIDPVIED